MDVITADEKTRLEGRLSELFALRPVITERIAEARAMGDLKENAEYHAAREQQGLDEAEIKRIQIRLSTAQVVSQENQAEDVVFIGSIVKLKDTKTGRETVYRLVGESAAEPDLDSDIVEVTTTSPMGESLMKARVGETIRVDAPRGVKRFEIVELL